MVHLVGSGGSILGGSNISIQHLLHETHPFLDAECLLARDYLDNDAELGRLRISGEEKKTGADCDKLTLGRVRIQVSILSRLDAESRLLEKVMRSRSMRPVWGIAVNIVAQMLKDYDEDSVGSLTKGQFVSMLSNLGIQLEADSIDKWFEESDKNRDQRLSTDELSLLLRSACFESLGVLPDLLSFNNSQETRGMARATSPCRKKADGIRLGGTINVRDRESGIKVVEKLPSYLKLAMRVPKWVGIHKHFFTFRCRRCSRIQWVRK
jgi:hypothetical protein